MYEAFEIDNGILVAYHGKEDNVIIPNGITAIGNNAFRNNSKITSVILPDGLSKSEIMHSGIA